MFHHNLDQLQQNLRLCDTYIAFISLLCNPLHLLFELTLKDHQFLIHDQVTSIDWIISMRLEASHRFNSWKLLQMTEVCVFMFNPDSLQIGLTCKLARQWISSQKVPRIKVIFKILTAYLSVLIIVLALLPVIIRSMASVHVSRVCDSIGIYFPSIATFRVMIQLTFTSDTLYKMLVWFVNVWQF